MATVRKTLKRVAGKAPLARQLLTERTDLRQAVEILTIEKQQLIARLAEKRSLISYAFLQGNGIEIGALHMPLPLPPDATVQYVDYLSVEGLRKHYPELRDLPLVDVAIVDNGERLTKVKNGSLDFIVANHFLEHCQDPIGTLVTFYKKLRSQGVIYMCIPNKVYTFDMDRPVTTYEHLLQEHKQYPSKQLYLEHCREIAKHTEQLKTEAEIEKCIQCLVDTKYSIHYHVWNQAALGDFFYRLATDFSLNLNLDAMIKNQHEIICVLRKYPASEEKSKIAAIRKTYFSDLPPIWERLGVDASSV
ncbi:MAG TPA: class I SAM-dependent methyltransferase [Verrucomicrobiae bacterium]|nr:class I SAM-dependent methyltransferase [Verrucomicrobiae bacterium]